MHTQENSKLSILPCAQDLWEGIAGHFDALGQVLCEFIDNSVSNFEAHGIANRSVIVTFTPPVNGLVAFTVEDNGSGIHDLNPVMRLGDKSARETPLNEHGFGLKHALATANPTNDRWRIVTRTKDDLKQGRYRVLESPYSFSAIVKVNDEHTDPWPGKFNGTGTIISFECSESLFNTVRKGIKGNPGFPRRLDYLREDLGYVYSGLIHDGKITISVNCADLTYNETVKAVIPNWQGYYKPNPGKTQLDLGGGPVDVDFRFGEMAENTDHFKHYKRNQATSGVEIRINGRVMMSKLFQEIWHVEVHPQYNHFLVILDLTSKNRNALPKTRTAKNGIRAGDSKLDKLFEWIRGAHPTPPKDLTGVQTKKELINQLKESKNRHIRHKAKRIDTELRVFATIKSPVPVDLYVFDGTDRVLYQAERDTADVRTLYQLLMCWDGAVEDGIKPDEGILVASSFSVGLDSILASFNDQKDRRGNPYNFTKRTWRQEGVEYPKE